MTPQLTMLASTLGIALVGSTFLPQTVGPDNATVTNISTESLTAGEVYAAYFPSTGADITDENAPRLQRDITAQPVFSTAIDPDSPLQRKLTQARQANQRQQTRTSATSKTRTANSSKSSSTTGATQRRGGTKTIVELARTRLASLNRDRFRSLSSRNREVSRRQQLRKIQSRRQPRTLRRSNVRESLRNNASRRSSSSN